MTREVLLYGKKEVDGKFVPREVGDVVNLGEDMRTGKPAGKYRITGKAGGCMCCFPGGRGICAFQAEFIEPAPAVLF